MRQYSFFQIYTLHCILFDSSLEKKNLGLCLKGFLNLNILCITFLQNWYDTGNGFTWLSGHLIQSCILSRRLLGEGILIIPLKPWGWVLITLNVLSYTLPYCFCQRVLLCTSRRKKNEKKNDSTGVLLDNMLATVCRDIPGQTLQSLIQGYSKYSEGRFIWIQQGFIYQLSGHLFFFQPYFEKFCIKIAISKNVKQDFFLLSFQLCYYMYVQEEDYQQLQQGNDE